MFVNRITRAAVVALAIAAAAAPAASARPVDTKEYTLPHNFRAADVDREAVDAKPYTLPHDFKAADVPGDAVIQRGLYEPMLPEDQPKPPVDLRMPDTIDAANGRGAENSPEVVVVEAPAPAPQPIADGMDWADVGLGAGSLLAIALMGAGGAVLVARRRDAGGLAT